MGDNPSKGRQKIEIAKIQKKSHLQVTFSKRRAGLFKKASELCTLCGAKIAILAFSPGGKAFSFGHPDVQSILHSFSVHGSPTLNLITEAHDQGAGGIRKLNLQLAEVLSQVESEKKRGEELSQMRKANQAQHWWEAPIEELNLEELQGLKAAMEELKKMVESRAEQLFMETVDPSIFHMVNGNPLVGEIEFDFERKHSGMINHGQYSVARHVHNFGYGQGFY